MKKLILILTIVTTSISIQNVHAQDWPTPGSYLTNTTMGAFHGTWQWTSGTDTVKIYLITKKVYFDLNGGFYWDRLVGWHLYKKGNIIVESSYPALGNVDARTFLGGNESSSSPATIIGGDFKDLKKNKYGDLTLTLNGTGNQMTWKLENSEGVSINPYDINFTLPTNMVLIKQ